jgi:deazaflavin-dependent oxidoreductase (nitroreductase family)
MIGGILKQLGATRPGVWVIRHVVAPLDRRLYRWTNGRFLSAGRPLAPTLLLTTTGRKSGQPHTTPLFYLRDGPRLILCNVNPGFERPNPWTLNIRARPCGNGADWSVERPLPRQGSHRRRDSPLLAAVGAAVASIPAALCPQRAALPFRFRRELNSTFHNTCSLFSLGHGVNRVQYSTG